MTTNLLMDWRRSSTLVQSNLQGTECTGPGITFRGHNAHVETPAVLNTPACYTTAALYGTAKPGPCTDTSSRIARIKKLQTRTRSTKVFNEDDHNGTRRGAHATVENDAHGVSKKSARAQLFGDLGDIPTMTSGRGGDSSQVIYFKNVFDRISLNNPKAMGAGKVDNN